MTELTVSDLLDAWMAQRGGLWAPSTIATHQSIVRRIRADLGDTPLPALTVEAVERYYADLSAGSRRGVNNSPRPLAPATVHRVHSVLLAALNQAYRWEWIDRNPAHRAARRPRTHRSQSLDSEGLLRVVRGIPVTKPFGVLCRLAVITGARRGELCALRAQDLNVDSATLRIARAISVAPGSVRVEQGTKTGRARTVRLDRAMVAYLEALARQRDAQAARVGKERHSNPFLVSASVSGDVPLGPNSVTTLWGRWRCRLAPVPGGYGHLRFGDLRHLNVSHLLNLGVPVPAVAARVGHATPATTLRAYAHCVAVDDYDAADLMASLLGAP